MSRPWMPLWVGDYLRDTEHLTTVEHGAYMLLIMHYWTHLGLPDDEKILQKISRTSPYTWSKISPTISKFFGPGWTHKRIDAELKKQAKITGLRKDAAMKRHGTGYANAGGEGMQMQKRFSANAGKPNKKIISYAEPPPVSPGLSKLFAIAGKKP